MTNLVLIMILQEVKILTHLNMVLILAILVDLGKMVQHIPILHQEIVEDFQTSSICFSEEVLETTHLLEKVVEMCFQVLEEEVNLKDKDMTPKYQLA